MYLRTMRLKIYKLDPEKVLLAPGLAWEAALKNKKVKLGLLTNIDMLLMVENCLRGRICHSIYRYAKANSKELSYLQYWDLNNSVIESDKGYFLEFDVQYLEQLHKLHNDLPFLWEWMMIEKVEKSVANIRDKTEYVNYIANLNKH